MIETPTPFQIYALIILFLAVVHTFLTPTLQTLSEGLAKKKDQRHKHWKFYHFTSEIVYMLSEVEVVFGIWLIPLLIGFTLYGSWNGAVAYLNSRDYTYALYIMVIVVVIASRPIVSFSESILEWFARLGKDTPGAWWWAILTVGPLLGSLIKEPGAMALSAILLTKKFYPFNASRAFKYATLGLLFANVSVGGMLTPFASRALFLVAQKWDWTLGDMLRDFGWKAIIAIILANFFYYLLFRKEFKTHFPEKLPTHEKEKNACPTPFWITAIHILFVALIAITGEDAPLFIGVFLIFLGFHRATIFYQTPLHLKSAILVGFFFASLVIHGELQGWWILWLLKGLSDFGVMIATLIMSAFIDNATVIYLSLELSHYTNIEHYAVVAGAMIAGGLTVIANAPNPIGHAILRRSFGGKISFSLLFLASLPPTAIFFVLFWMLKPR